MKTSSSKVKLTVTIEGHVLETSKKVASAKRIPLSGLIENYLDWMSDPKVYCFKCGERFATSGAKVCTQCGWLQCTECKVCRCGLDPHTTDAIFHMRKTFEDLLGGRMN